MRGWWTVGIATALVTGLLATGVPARQLELTIRLDPDARTLDGHATITLEQGEGATLQLAAAHTVMASTLNGEASPHARGDGHHVWRIAPADRTRRFHVAWRAQGPEPVGNVSEREALRADRIAVDRRGTFAPAGAAWHPVAVEGFSGYRVTLDAPGDHPAVVPGELESESVEGGRYRVTIAFQHQTGGVDLMAGPYHVTSREHRTPTGKQVRLRTYFHPELADLARGYLDDTARHIDRYDRAIGTYPYGTFSVVSSPTPTGFGMPALTYLGAQVLRLPFIRETSLGHEVLHNWWGNGVFVDYTAGNWSEGLTTFMADYAYREEAGTDAARAMRLDWLRDLAVVPPSEDRPLRQFTGRHHTASQIIGYRKTAMLFSMMRDEIGPEVFADAMRAFWTDWRFRAASWQDLIRTVERVGKRDLAPYRTSWLDRTGLPAVRLAAVRRNATGTITVTLTRAEPSFRVRVPVRIEGTGTSHVEVLELEESEREKAFELRTSIRAGRVVLDPDYRALRAIAPGETPPILRQVMASASPLLVTPGADDAVRAAAGKLAAVLLDQQATPVDADKALPPGDALIVGLEPQVDRWLGANWYAPRPAEVSRTATARIWTVRREGGVALIVVAQDAANLEALARPLPHYGRQSWLAAEGSRIVDRGIWPAVPQSLAFDGER